MSTGSPLPPSSEQKPDVQKENTPSANYIGDGKTGQRKNAPKALWECNICLETAKEPIITQCGHLYCWPCIHKYVRFSRQQEIIFSRLLISSSSSYRHIVIVTIDVSDNLSSSSSSSSFRSGLATGVPLRSLFPLRYLVGALEFRLLSSGLVFSYGNEGCRLPRMFHRMRSWDCPEFCEEVAALA